MKIGVIGAGKMGSGLGDLWVEQGHQVMFCQSRRQEREKTVTPNLHVRSGTPREAVQFADVLLLAVPWTAVRDALTEAGPLDGKLLLTCVNPIGPLGLQVGLTSSAAEEIAKLAPGAIVVEAFNSLFAGLLQTRAHLFGNNTPTVFYCGGDRDAKTTVAQLIVDAGFHPTDAGPLQNARYLEPLAMLMTQLAHTQHLGSDIALRLMRPAGPVESVRTADVLARSLAVLFAGVEPAPGDADILAEDFVAYLPYSRHAVRGREAFEARLAEFHSAFSNFECDVEEVVDDGMRIAIRWTWRGTHTGDFLGIAPTHRKIELSETHLLRISAGRIAEDHVSANLLDLLHQLGATQFAAA